MANRSRSSVIHLVCGLYAAIFVVALGVSGAILAFHDELDRALNPKLSYVVPTGAQKPLAQLEDAVKQKYPGYEVQGVQLPTSADLSTLIIIGHADPRSGMAVAIDQYTGVVLGDSDHANNFADHVREFHSDLMWRGPGSAILWFSAVGCFALSITGVILWSRRKRLAPSSPGSPTFSLDLHSALGIYTAAFVFLYAITAIRPVPAGLVVPKDFFRPPHFNIVAAENAQPMSLEQLLDVAKKALPGAVPIFISSDPKRPTFVAMRYPEDHSERPKSGVLLDPYSGAVLHKVDLRSLNALQKFGWAWNMEIHTGAIFGTPSKIVAAATSLVIPLLGVTGPVIWWRRRRSKMEAGPVNSKSAGGILVSQ